MASHHSETSAHHAGLSAGAASIDITPPVGGELSGFAARVQPSTGVLHPLSARALWIVDGARRLLWLHCDLIGFSADFVAEVRAWAKRELGLHEAEVMLSATHTHAGPATIHLEGAGEYDVAYLRFLHAALQQVTRSVLAAREPCTLSTALGSFDLAVHRTGPGTRHVDPRLLLAGFRRSDGSYIAILGNYAIHPVALGPENRAISGDLHGWAASELARLLPGAPIVLLTNGACGNLNPPAVNVPFTQVQQWGSRLAQVMAGALEQAGVCGRQHLGVARRLVKLPLDRLNLEEMDAFVARTQASLPASSFGEKLGSAALKWREIQASALRSQGSLETRIAEIHAVQLGDLVLVGLNAEIFSIFNEWLRHETSFDRMAVVGYANGDLGYICPRAAYADGGYEVDMAHVFYGGWRFAPGALERLAREAPTLVRTEIDCSNASNSVGIGNLSNKQ